MRKLTLILLGIVFICGLSLATTAQSKAKAVGTAPNGNVKPTGSASASKDPIGDADRLLTRGDDPVKDRQALTMLESALPTNSNNYDFVWRAARAFYYVGDFGEKPEKMKYFEKGIIVALRAVALKPDAVEGHFWLAANYGGKAELVGSLKALSTVKKIRNEMLIVLKLDASYEMGNAYLALGEIDRELPAIAGGDKKRAISYFQEGIKIAPDNLDTKVSLAKAYTDAKRHDDAHRLLEEVIKAQPTTRIQRAAQDEAKQLLNK